MAKSQQTFNKKENEKKRLKKRQDKLKKQEERKSKSSKLDDMIAYVDENGNITNTPPNLVKKEEIDAESIQISTPKKEDVIDPIRKGRVEYFDTAKGFGFIIDLETKEKFFFHVNNVTDEVKENNLVSFEVEQGLKGLNAVRVKKV